MKKIILCALCVAVALTAASCGGKKNSETQNPSIGDIPTAEANKDKNDSESPTDENADQNENNADSNGSGSKSDNDKSSTGGNSNKVDTSDRTAASDRAEIQNNIRDAKELIDDGLIDDAKAIIRVLRSRELTRDEEKQVDELERKMLKVSD